MPFIVSIDHLLIGKPLYEEARRIATDIVLTAAETLHNHGFDEILIADSHGPMVNLRVEELPEYVELIRGFPRPTSMIVDIGQTDVAVFLGYHAKSATPHAIFDHTYSGSLINRLKINEVEVSEYLLNAYFAGHYNVPVILVAGDEKLMEDVSQFTPWTEKVIFKKSYSRYSARSKNLKVIKKTLRESLVKAVNKFKNKETKPLKVKNPVSVEVEFKSSGYADIAELLPGATRVDGLTVKLISKDIVEAYRVFELLVFACAGVKSMFK